MCHGTYFLIGHCPVQKDPGSVSDGERNERGQLTNRCGRAKVLSRVGSKQGWLFGAKEPCP